MSGWMGGRVDGWMINRKKEKKEVMYLQVPVFFAWIIILQRKIMGTAGSRFPALG